MKYFYYPGCSLEGTAVEYDASTRAVMKKLRIELLEIEDWTCCGASAVDTVSNLLSMVLPARNLALAEKTGIKADFLVPCSACYLNLKKVEDRTRKEESLFKQVNEVLAEEALSYQGILRPRHLMDVLATDIGSKKIAALVERPLKGLRVAPYYGCQALRPFVTFDDPEQPSSMNSIIEALGAEVHPWSMGARCCGAGLMTTKQTVGLERVVELLKAAKGADCIVTICPMCQMNLDSYQNKAIRKTGEDLSISVLYLPQLIGLALGVSQDELKLKANFAVTPSFYQRIQSAMGEKTLST